MTWDEIRAKVLAVEPKAGPILDILAQYWGDGKLTADLAQRFVAFYAAGDLVEAKKLIYQTADAAALISADQAENQKLAAMIDQEKKLYDFGGQLAGAVLKIALGAALAMVGL